MKKIFNDFKDAAFLTAVFTLVMSKCVFAYIDPSVMTYAIQAVAGIVIALGAALGVYFRRARRKISEKMHIEESKNKEFESDDIIINNEVEEN